ncbi:DUF2802 domain-containing protein, partial [Tepidibacillus decaturensis]|uniref:DUF2802 domain-containing protein n=3 Tax=Bacillaceae TaxID=186817 RepID=UPI001379A8DD
AELNRKMKNVEERLDKIERDKGTNHVNPRYAQIFELYQSGASIDAIAKKMKMGHGEIELILELAKKGLKYV